MKRNLVAVLLLFVTTVILSAVQKPLFMLWYDVPVAEWIDVVWHGLMLDMTMAGYVCALPVLLLLFAIALPHKLWRVTMQVWLYVAAAFIAVSFAVNLGLYEFWGFPLDASILQYLATPKQAAASVTLKQFAVQCVVAIAYFAALAYAYRTILRLLDTTAVGKRWWRAVWAIVVVLLVGVDFLAIRGGVTTAVANVSKVYFSDKAILNHAAVQPAFSFLSSIGDDVAYDRYCYFDELQCAQGLTTPPLAVDAEVESVLTVERPDIVLILAESFGRTTVDEVVDGVSVAPNLQRLKDEGIWFENLYASSFRTDRGVLATLSGFCAQPTMSLMKYPAKAAALPSIASSLREAGYSTSYIHGGDLNFTDMSSYLYATGFETLVALKDLSFDAPTSKWGYADDVLSDYFVDYVSSLHSGDKPYFAVWQTLSSHEPFDVPVDCFEDRMLCSMNFADSCISSVVERLRSSDGWDNMLVVIIADHAYKYPYNSSASATERHHIPMLWLGGAVREPMVVESFCSQSDFAATLLAQLGCDTSRFVLSRNIFAPKSAEFGYYTFNNGFGVVQADGAMVYDCTSDRPISTDVSPEREYIGKMMLQSTYRLIKEL